MQPEEINSEGGGGGGVKRAGLSVEWDGWRGGEGVERVEWGSEASG